MRYLVIGLGIYGTNLALELTAMGHEVIGADNKHSNVEAIKDYISTAYIIDSTDEQALSVLPLKNVDMVIVAIGENFGASVRTVALLKKLGVKHIYARAIDKIHEAILEGFNVDRIITPEQRAARDLAHELELGTTVDVLKIDNNNYVMKFKAPDIFIGSLYSELELMHDYGLMFITATRPAEKENIMGINNVIQQAIFHNNDYGTEKVEEGDVFTVFGSIKAFKALYKSVKN